MANGTIAPFPKHQLFTNAGLIASGYKLFTYAAGTTTKLNTYSDADLAIGHVNSNPIVLDSAGRATIFLTAASYKFVFAPPTDSDPPVSPIWTVDNVSAVAPFFQDIDVQGTAGEALSAGDGVYMSAGDGGLTAGRWYKWDADLTYASANANAVGMAPDAIASGETGAIRIAGRVTGLSGLAAGTPYYISRTAAQLTASGPPNTRTVGVADSSTSIILSHTVIPQQDVMGQAGEDLAEGNIVYLSEGQGGKSGGKWYKADATNIYSSVTAPLIGIAKMAILTSATGPITTVGRQGGYTVTAGQDYYVDTTPGGITAAPTTNRRLVGFADSSNSLRLAPGSQSNILTIQRSLLTSNHVDHATGALADLNGLSFNIGESEIWSFRIYLYGNSPTAADLKFKITVPAAIVSIAYGILGSQNPVNVGAALTTATTIDQNTQAFDEMFTISGIISNGVNAGTVQLRFAQNTSTTADSTIYVNSYLVAEQVRGN